MLYPGLRHIKYVIAVAEHRGVSAAANSINISQPALSVAIATLEEHLGQPLFIRRKGHPLTLTSFGREFIKQATDLVDQFEQLLNPNEVMAEYKRPIVLGCFDDLGPIITGPISALIRQRYQNVNLQIEMGSFDSLIDKMIAGTIDFSITYDLGLDAIFNTQQIAEILPHVLIYPDHPFNNRKKIRLKDLEAESLILVNQEHSIWHMTNLFRQYNLIPKITHRIATFEIMRSMVANKLGISISYTKSQSNTSYDGKELIYKEIADKLLPQPIVIASNCKNPLSPFTQTLIKEIAGIRDLFY